MQRRYLRSPCAARWTVTPAEPCRRPMSQAAPRPSTTGDQSRPPGVLAMTWLVWRALEGSFTASDDVRTISGLAATRECDSGLNPVRTTGETAFSGLLPCCLPSQQRSRTPYKRKHGGQCQWHHGERHEQRAEAARANGQGQPESCLYSATVGEMKRNRRISDVGRRELNLPFGGARTRGGQRHRHIGVR